MGVSAEGHGRVNVGTGDGSENNPCADTDPLVPYGTDPHTPYVLGYHVSNHDESYTTNGQLATPF